MVQSPLKFQSPQQKHNKYGPILVAQAAQAGISATFLAGLKAHIERNRMSFAELTEKRKNIKAYIISNQYVPPTLETWLFHGHE